MVVVEMKWITWVPRVSGGLSFLGSSLIIYIMVSSNRKRDLTKPKNRLMLSMSFFDLFQSSAFVVGRSAMPRETGLYGSAGNSRTCTVQGAFVGLGFAVMQYNASLNLFYLLTIYFKMDQAYFSAKIEPFLHTFSIMGPLIATTRNIILGNFKP
uniref:Uncharacterized protein n=1 Tax=Proboscia inermis TaxID=420281 RepID=A0A7S0GDN2_9STRA|mmetsp:Transcript_29387/g.29791  ORF Transcript_29387/g.29791 Transcript_29387/m.29791 type:complete len:154 (+) Transcript_29387:97-558(+)